MLLAPDALLAFERVGHCTHRGLLPPQRLQALQPSIDAAYASQQLAVHRQKLRVLAGNDALVAAEKEAARADKPLLAVLRRRLAALPDGCAPFLQAFNLWRDDPDIAVLASEVAGTAAELLGARRVRLYQDALFVKRPGDGPTHWHSDLGMCPLDTNSMVTCWLPLQPVPAERDGGSGLVFASGSHRDVALHFWHGDPSEAADCSQRGYPESEAGALALGDATWHHGWTLHCAGANGLRAPRRALALSFFADGATRLATDAKRAVHAEDAESYSAWIADVRPGAPARHRLLPVVWDGGKGAQQPAHHHHQPQKCAGDGRVAEAGLRGGGARGTRRRGGRGRRRGPQPS